LQPLNALISQEIRCHLGKSAHWICECFIKAETMGGKDIPACNGDAKIGRTQPYTILKEAAVNFVPYSAGTAARIKSACGRGLGEAFVGSENHFSAILLNSSSRCIVKNRGKFLLEL
jgi:hypothetical protein